jgi:hypothetical protein
MIEVSQTAAQVALAAIALYVLASAINRHFLNKRIDMLKERVREIEVWVGMREGRRR